MDYKQIITSYWAENSKWIILLAILYLVLVLFSHHWESEIARKRPDAVPGFVFNLYQARLNKSGYIKSSVSAIMVNAPRPTQAAFYNFAFPYLALNLVFTPTFVTFMFYLAIQSSGDDWIVIGVASLFLIKWLFWVISRLVPALLNGRHPRE